MRNVFFLGLVSFFTDISTEMVYPLIPLYLTAVLGATPALVGVIEGIAESLSSLLKVFSGYISDRSQKKKGLAFAGYSTGIIYKLVLLVAGSWAGILGARVIDRIGKGIRTAPRDVLVSESAAKNRQGRAFGLHKMLDMCGAAIGILITYFILSGKTNEHNYKGIFAVSIIPALLGLGMFFFIKQTPGARPAGARPPGTRPPGARPPGTRPPGARPAGTPKTLSGASAAQAGAPEPSDKTREPFWKHINQISGQLRLYLLVVFLFTLGNSSNTFLLLRAKSTGFDDADVILLYFVYNITASVLSLPFGGLSDRIGRKRLLVSGYLVFAVCYLGFACASSQPVMVGAFVAYGIFTAMTTGVERAYVAEISPPELKGTMLGLQSTVVGVALLPASVIAGLLWNAFGAAVPFMFGAALSVTAALLLAFLMKGKSASPTGALT